MIDENDPLRNVLGDASEGLRHQLDSQPIPEFRPPNDTARRAAMVAVAVVAGFAAWLGLRPDDTTQLDVTAPEPGTAETTSTPPSSSADPVETLDVLLAQWRPETGFDDRTPVADSERPPLGTWVAEPTWRTPIRRVTDTAGARFHRLQSAARPIVGPDGSLLTRRDEEWVLVESDPAEQRLTTLPRDAEPLWLPDGSVVHLAGADASSGELRLHRTVLGEEATVFVDLSDSIRATIPTASYVGSRDTGAPSGDGSRMAWAIYDETEAVVGFALVDLDEQRLLAAGPAPSDELGTFEYVSVSVSGRHVVAGYAEGVVVYDESIDEQRRIDQQPDRPALAQTADGADVLITANFDSATDDVGWIVTIGLDDGVSRRIHELFDGANTAIDFGVAPDRPGWVVASTFDCKQAVAWSCDRVLLLDIDDGTIVNLAHTYSCAESIFAEPLAVPNADLTAVWFNSDAGSCTDAAEIYEIHIPERAFDS